MADIKAIIRSATRRFLRNTPLEVCPSNALKKIIKRYRIGAL